MSLHDYAKSEMERTGWYDGDMNEEMANDIMALIDVLASQGHSGFSAAFCIHNFDRLASYKPLGPLTGEDDEWNEVSDDLWQNNRCSHVFKTPSGAYDSEGIVFKDKNGCYYTNVNSRVSVTFPYNVPDEPKIVERDE